MPQDFDKASAQADSIFRLLNPQAPKLALERLPAFPFHAFPQPARDFIRNSAASARVAPEMIAAPFLAFAGSTIGDQVTIDVGQGWIERPVLWIVLVATIGGGKTPAISAALRPLEKLQEEILDDWACIEPDRQTEFPSKPDRLFTTDPTMEALIADLQSSRGIAIVRDELIGLVRGLNQNRGHRGDDRQKYLSLWSHQPIAPSRRSKLQTYIPHPVVSIVGGVQPGVLPDLRSRTDDGLIQRFLPIVTALPVRYWSETANTRADLPDVDAMTDLFRLLRSIASKGEQRCVQRHPDARSVWSAWYNENIDRIEAVPHALRAWYLKLPAHVARIALILHLLEEAANPDRPLSGETMRHAIELGEYFRGHIHRMVPFFGQPTLVLPPRPSLESRIRRTLAESAGSDGWLNRTDLYHRVGRPRRSDLSKALKTLLDKKAIQSQTVHKPNATRPTTLYRLS